MKKHIFIMVRYSVLTESRDSWKIGRDVTEEEYGNNLLSEERLAFRYELFKKITFPSLLQFNKSNTTVLIFTSQLMPKKHQDDLEDLVEAHPWIKLVPLSSEGRLIGKMHQTLLKELARNNEELCYATVRLDDDDALSREFYSTLIEYVNPVYSGHAISFGSGFTGIYGDNGFKDFYHLDSPKIALGLSFIQMYVPNGAEPKPVSIFGLGNHVKIDKKVPVVLDSRVPAYIRTVHEKSDAYNEGMKKRLSSGNLATNDEIKNNFEHLDIRGF